MSSWSDIRIRVLKAAEHLLDQEYGFQDLIRGGALIYAKRSCNDNKISPIACDRFCIERNIECCTVKVMIGGHFKYCVICAYRPPNGDMDLFLTKAAEVLLNCQKYSPNIYLNIDSLNDSIGKLLLFDFFECFQLRNNSMKLTRIFRDINDSVSSTKIDYIVTNVEHEKINTVVV
ncbi:hypothetical protein HHI36_002127 [Cryptolaemus montrouzieri]|uniref:Uncharacterized protein n=1 Tax=Cryptolaemus montrouzieri TaxID=559131 RepID=A0ABD2PAY4_9CUCU